MAENLEKLEVNALPTTINDVVEIGDIVWMHYSGKLVSNGVEFDSSYKRGEPFQTQIGIGRVIRGWDQGVPGMKVGEKRRLNIPADMGYGARGSGETIPPNADLTFDVELVGLVKTSVFKKENNY